MIRIIGKLIIFNIGPTYTIADLLEIAIFKEMLNNFKISKALFVLLTVMTLITAAYYSSRNAGLALNLMTEEEHRTSSLMVNLVEEKLHEEKIDVVQYHRVGLKTEAIYPDHINLSIPTLIFDLTKPPSYS